MKIEEKYISSSLYRTKSPYSMTPQYITIHNTANDASANNEYTFMTKTNASSTTGWHIVVDDVKAIYAVPLNRNSWHAGDGGNGPGNRKSIGIEICYSKSGGERYNKAEENCVQLVAMLLKRYGWGIDRVKKHQDWSGKYCPHRILAEGRWESFKNRIAKAMGGTPTPDKPNAGSTVYRTHTLKGSYLEWVKGYGNGNDGYSGVYGRSIDGLQIKDRVYQVHIKGMLRGKWLDWVTGYGNGIDGYAGIYGRAIDGIRVKGTSYRVHIKGGSWLPWVNKCDNTNNGYAGIYGKEIDGIQIK